MKVSKARDAAFQVLLRVETRNAYSAVLLAEYEDRLSAIDRALCHELTLGTLRRQMHLDAVTDAFSKRKAAALDPEVRIALRLGLYQLMFLDKVPDHAAVNESVNLVIAAGKRSAGGLVNAVLRRVSREGPDLSFPDEVERLSVLGSHPRWLVERWVARFGPAEALALIEMNNLPRPYTFRFTRTFDLAEPEFRGEIVRKLEKENSLNRSELKEDAFVAQGQTELLRRLAEQNYIYFQDAGSQLVADAAAPGAEGSVLDLCAAPGGKTTCLARRADPGPGKFVACELHHARAVSLKENCVSQGCGFVEVLRLNAEKDLPVAERSFDRVLVDAPCSGTGTLSGNPEIRYRLRPEDLPDLAGKQRRILNAASKAVKQGGILIYSTCSLEPEENEDVFAGFLSDHPDFAASAPRIRERLAAGKEQVRILPQTHGTDGFFIAAAERLK